jgi:hypothetical protein
LAFRSRACFQSIQTTPSTANTAIIQDGQNPTSRELYLVRLLIVGKVD